MTTTENTENTETSPPRVGIPVRLDIDTLAPDLGKALTTLDRAATKELDKAGIAAGLRDLLKLRASQINGCAYCVDMHTKDARNVGESDERIAGVAVWRDTPFFTAYERAVLTLTEAVTTMNVGHVPDEEYEAVAEDLGEQEIAGVLAAVVAINAWNAVGVATHAWEPGSYQP